MSINPIKQFVIRCLKESNYYHKLMKIDCGKRNVLNTIHFQSLVGILENLDCIKSKQFQKLLRMKYHTIVQNPLCILDVKDGTRLQKYLNDNGILWNNGKFINDLNDIIKLNKSISIIVLDRGTIQFSTADRNSLYNKKRYEFFEEEEFYPYYDNLREEIFKQFKTMIEDVKY